MKATQNDSHPNREDLTAYLYDDLAPDRHALIERHLATCAACRTAADEFRQTMSSLDAWRTNDPPSKWPGVVRMINWGLAAAVCLGLGLAAGRFTRPTLDPEALRTEIAAAVREELRHEFAEELLAMSTAIENGTDRKLLDLASAWTQARKQDREMILVLHNRSLEQRRAEMDWLRRDLETVAINADQSLNATQRKLVQLAAASHPLLRTTDFLAPEPENTERKIPQ